MSRFAWLLPLQVWGVRLQGLLEDGQHLFYVYVSCCLW